MTTTATTTHLHLQDLAAPERTAAVLAAFDALGPSETLTLVDASRPKDALEALRERRRGLFEWSPVPVPSGSAVEVFRRDAAGKSLRGVNEALSWDHDRLDALEKEAFAFRAKGETEAARSTFAVFRQGLVRHIGFEEDVLFPAFEERAGFPSSFGPTAVMRQEHRQIQALLEGIGEALADPGTRAEDLRRELHLVLGEHNAKEEGVLYPGTDAALTPAEADELVYRIQSYAG